MNNLDRITKKTQTVMVPPTLVTRKTIAIMIGLLPSTVQKIICEKKYKFPIMKMLIGRTETWDKQSVLNWMKTENYVRRKISDKNARSQTDNTA